MRSSSLFFLAVAALVGVRVSAHDLVCTVVVDRVSRDVVYLDSDKSEQPTRFNLHLRRLSLLISSEPKKGDERDVLKISLVQKPPSTSRVFVRKKTFTLAELIAPLDSQSSYTKTFSFNNVKQKTSKNSPIANDSTPPAISTAALHCRPLLQAQATQFEMNARVEVEHQKLRDSSPILHEDEFLEEGNTRLHWLSATASVEEVTRYLQQNPNTDLNQVNEEGNTALHFAYLLDPNSVGAELVRLGADPDQKNLAGVTPNELKALGQGQVKTPTQVPFYNPQTSSLEWVTHAEASSRLGFFLTESPVASKWFYLKNALTPYLNEIIEAAQDDEVLPRYSTASLFFASSPVGWAVHTLHDIEEGDYIGDYLGMLSSHQISLSGDSAYVLGLYCDDSQKIGGIVSRVNTSSCEAGANSRLGWTMRYGLKVQGLVASRKIRAGEEVLWFYAADEYLAHCIPGEPLKLEDRPALLIR